MVEFWGGGGRSRAQQGQTRDKHHGGALGWDWGGGRRSRAQQGSSASPAHPQGQLHRELDWAGDGNAGKWADMALGDTSGALVALAVLGQ